jgi:hypothetical protein
MANCKFCGDEIEFRTIRGRAIPLHSCESTFVETASTRRDNQDCCHRTLCPRCRMRYVFFVRHNGGSVWFDYLGPPWQQHSCFEETDKPEIPAFLLKIPRGIRCQPAQIVSCTYHQDFKLSVATVYLEDKWKIRKPLYLAIRGRHRLRGPIAISRRRRMVISERGEIFYVGEWKECGVCKMPHPPKITARHEAKELRKRERIASLLQKAKGVRPII